jgi:hypothetical protein
MGVLVSQRIIEELEAEGIGQRFRLVLGSHTECPGGAISGGAHRGDVVRLLGVGELVGFVRVDADGEHREVLPRPPIDLSNALGDTVEHQIAEHRALIVAQREQDRSAAGEQRTQRDGAALIGDDGQVHWQGVTEELDHVDALQFRGALFEDDLGGTGGRCQSEDYRGPNSPFQGSNMKLTVASHD